MINDLVAFSIDNLDDASKDVYFGHIHSVFLLLQSGYSDSLYGYA